MDFLSWQYLFRYSLGKPDALKLFREALRNQSLEPNELNEISWQKTHKLILTAFENVPWYNKKFSEIGLCPADIRSEEDFKHIPILTRHELKSNYKDFISKKTNSVKLKVSTTGGSTGTPLKIGMDPKVIREIPKWQMLSWWSISPAANMASLYRGIPMQGLRKVILGLISWPQRVVRLDATNITHKDINHFIKKFNKYQPELVHGYLGALDIISDYLTEHGITIKHPKVVWSTASPITKAKEMKIGEAFNAPICDQYGCSEIYYIAAECPKKEGLHIFSDAVKVEILDDKNETVPPGSYGKIVVTNLNEYSFPLIRYENGDYGRLLNNKCSCGLSLPLMDKVKGRISDNIVLPDGSVLSGEYLTTIFDNYTSEIRQFQIVQDKIGDITLKVALQGNCLNSEKILGKVENQLKSRLRNQVRLRIEIVSNIPAFRGKLQYIIKE